MSFEASIEQDLPGNLPANSQSSQTTSAADSVVDRAQTLGRLLRQIGSGLLILASVAFLVQRWDMLDHTMKYFSFLGFTLIMAAAGILCGIGIKEGKGARTLLTLVAAIIPVHFAQLGALLFSKFGTVLNPDHYPAILRWTAPSEFAALGTVGIAVLLLGPLLYFAYSTLDRSISARLTIGALVANAALLIPNRDPSIVLALALVTSCTMGYLDSTLRSLTHFRTMENRLARLTLFLPIGVLLGRQIILYSCSSGLIAFVLFAMAALLFVTIPRYAKSVLGDISQIAACAPLVAGWLFVLNELGFTGFHGDWLALPAFGIPVAAMLLYMSTYARRAQGVIQVAAAAILMLTSALELRLFPGFFGSAFSLMAVVGLIIAAITFERVLVLAIAVFGGFHTVIHHVRLIIESCDFSLWITLGGTGILTIVAASLIERHFGKIVMSVKKASASIAEWKV